MNIESFYNKFYNQDGLLTFINESDTGNQLLFYPDTKTFVETDGLTIKLRQREELYSKLDLSDLEVGKKKK